MKRVSHNYAVVCIVVLVFVILVSWEVPAAEAVTCNPTGLSSCLPALTTPAPPTMQCCDMLRAQEPCFCGYLQNPLFRRYLDSPNARKVANICGVPYPQC